MDPIADMMVRIKNAQLVNAEQVIMPFSRMKFQIATILRVSGYLAGVERRKRKGRTGEHEYLELGLSYQDGRGAIGGVKLVSKPSRHMYVKARKIKPVRSGYGMTVISTPKGVMTSSDARKQNIGGEILFEIW